jgi:hypothetical protein
MGVREIDVEVTYKLYRSVQTHVVKPFLF